MKEMKLKLSYYRKELQRLRSRRDVQGVRNYNKIRWHYLKLLEKQKFFGDKELNNIG